MPCSNNITAASHDRPAPVVIRCAVLLCFIVAALALLPGCATHPPRELSRAAPPGTFLPNGGTPADPTRIDPRLARWGLIGLMERDLGRPIQVLEISGGGQYGAFGAGFLNGWSESGTRPPFDLVTGISTGALLATHAFLGTPADEAALKQLYTGIERRDIYRGSALGALFGGPALNRTEAMAALIEKTITPEVLERVAAEFDQNRRLFVAATNLDYKQVWVFSLGDIAKLGGEEGLALYRKVLQAAASPPVVFPPVEIGGHLFGDAAVRENLLLMGMLGRGETSRSRGGQRGNIYVIVNGQYTTPPDAVPYALSPIAGDALNAMLSGRMQTTLVLAYAGARVHGYRFNLVALPDAVPISGNPLAFDRVEMRRVFDAGRRLGRSPDPWLDRPPASDQLGPWVIGLFDHLDRLPR
jgi:predicted acylesterase/phospholipase RssA